jgi:hypothetical protein
MAKVPPPSVRGKGLPPSVADTLENLDRAEAGGTANLNFKVSPEFHREFKVFAATHGLRMNETLTEAFSLLKAKRG